MGNNHMGFNGGQYNGTGGRQEPIGIRPSSDIYHYQAFTGPKVDEIAAQMSLLPGHDIATIELRDGIDY